jgi:hypothetical protein
MANLLLTELCVRSCPYCFAKEYMDGKDTNYLKWKDLVFVVDLHSMSNEPISFLGGEPFLHPFLVDFILYTIKRGIHVNVFTSGIVNEAKLSEMIINFYPIAKDKLSFVVNLNHPSLNKPSEQKRINRFLETMGMYSSLSYNIYHEEFELDFLLEAICKYGLQRSIRFGLAQPIPGKKNIFISKEKLPVIAKRFLSYEDKFEMLQIRIGFDCGMPMCLFSEEEIGKLFKLSFGKLNFGCGPAVDIGTDLTVWPCFPLSNYQNKSLYEFKSLQEIKDYYINLHGKVRGEIGGIFTNCDECNYRKNRLCAGGCLSHPISEMSQEPKIRHEEVYLSGKTE